MKLIKLPGIICSVLSLILLISCTGEKDPKTAFQKGDYHTAFELWMPKAQQGDVEAQNYLGIQYTLGLGVEKNYKEALNWYEKAAKAGFPDAQRNYGDMFHYGKGVPQDFYKAFVWYFAASQQGHKTAEKELEHMTDTNKLTPNQQMHAKLEANAYIEDPAKRFISHDTYIKKQTLPNENL